MWLYSVIFGILKLRIAGDPVGMVDLVKIFFPITAKRFWFVNSYLALYILSPFLNKLITSLSKRHLTTLVMCLILLFSIRTTIFPEGWSQGMDGGMGLISFIMLYFIAAWIRLYYKPDGKLKKWIALYLGMAGCLVLSRFVILKISVDSSNRLYKNNSPLVILEAIAFFMIFLNRKQWNEKLGKIINGIAKHSFSVYIIHFSVLGVLFTKIIPLNTYVNHLGTGVAAILLSVIGIYVVCTVIDIGKCFLFKKVGEVLNKTIVGKGYYKFCMRLDVLMNDNQSD